MVGLELSLERGAQLFVGLVFRFGVNNRRAGQRKSLRHDGPLWLHTSDAPPTRHSHAAMGRLNLLYDGVGDTFGSLQGDGAHSVRAVSYYLGCLA
jgi:hypothetical protein